MFHLDPDSRYIDIMERALYNGVLSGVSFEGSHFFYANPLASYPHVNPYERWSTITDAQHYHRSEWFDCACCPPNLARLVTSIGAYFYSTTPDTLYVHLYNQNRAQFQFGGRAVQIEQQTDYPWDSTIRLIVGIDQATPFQLALRIPAWCRDFRLEVNGKPVSASPVGGYVHPSREWANGDEVTLSLAMPVERMAAHPHVREDAGRVALQRGPVVYCLEEVDNGSHLVNIVLPNDARLTAGYDPALFGGVGIINGDAMRLESANWPGGLYQPQSTFQYSQTPMTFKAIPYCFWANREPGEMRVWIRES
jgi:hypothetical protein